MIQTIPPTTSRRKLRRGYNNSSLFSFTQYGEGAGGSKRPTEATFHITVQIGRESYTTAAVGLPTNIRHGWKWLALTNILAYYGIELNTAVKLWWNRPKACSMKHYRFVIYGFHRKLVFLSKIEYSWLTMEMRHLLVHFSKITNS